MKKIQNLKRSMLIFFLAYFAFAVSIEALTGRFNLFPFYNWKIFHVYPIKYETRKVILFHEIDGKKLDPPKGGIGYIIKNFPSIDSYTFSRKVNSIGWADIDSEKRIQNINFELTRDHDRVRWGLYQVTLDPIEFFLSSRVKTKRLLSEHFAINKAHR